MSASSPAARPHEYNAEIGVLRFPRRKIGQQRRLPEGNHLRAGEVLRHGVIALLFKLRQRTALQRRRAASRRSGRTVWGRTAPQGRCPPFSATASSARRLRFAAPQGATARKPAFFPIRRVRIRLRKFAASICAAT